MSCKAIQSCKINKKKQELRILSINLLKYTENKKGFLFY